MSDRVDEREDGPSLIADDLVKVLRNHEKRIVRLEENPIGCKFTDDFFVIVPDPDDIPDDPGCGVCWIVAGTTECHTCPEDEGFDCRGCVEDVMGSPRWQHTAADVDGPHAATYNAAGNFYYGEQPNMQTLIWPDTYPDQTQSIEFIAANMGLHADQQNYVSGELRRHDLFLYGDGLRFVLTMGGPTFDVGTGTVIPWNWYWWVEWYNDPAGDGSGDYIYHHYADDDPGWDPHTWPFETMTVPTWVDDFERANGAIGPNWVVAKTPDWNGGGVVPFTIQSGAAVGEVVPPTELSNTTAMYWHEPQGTFQAIEIEIDADWSTDGYCQLFTNANATNTECEWCEFSFTDNGDGTYEVVAYLDRFNADGTHEGVTGTVVSVPIALHPIRVRYESDRATNTRRLYYNDDLIATRVDANTKSGNFVGMGLEPVAVSPRILSANGSVPAFKARLECDTDNKFRFFINDSLMLEDHPAVAVPADASKVGLWVDINAGGGAFDPTIEQSTHVHDICINGFGGYDSFTGAGWEQRPVNDFERSEATGDLVGNYMYIVGGRVPNTAHNALVFTADVWRYNPATNDFTTAAANGIGGAFLQRARMVSATIGDKLYMGLGTNTAFAIQTALWEWTPATDTWVAKASFPGVAGNYDTTGSMCSIGTKLYHASRNPADNHLRLVSWDQATNAWTILADGPQTIASTGHSEEIVAYNGDVYLFVHRGGGPSPPSNRVSYRYNVASNTYTTLAPIPGPTLVNSTADIYRATVLGDSILLIARGIVFEYKPATDTWTLDPGRGSLNGVEDMPVASSAGVVNTTPDGEVHYLTGSSATGVFHPLDHPLVRPAGPVLPGPGALWELPTVMTWAAKQAFYLKDGAAVCNASPTAGTTWGYARYVDPVLGDYAITIIVTQVTPGDYQAYDLIVRGNDTDGACIQLYVQPPATGTTWSWELAGISASAVRTVAASGSVLGVTSPTEIRLAAVGEDITAYINGSEIGSVTTTMTGDRVGFGNTWHTGTQPRIESARVVILGGECGTEVPSIEGWRAGAGPVFGGFRGPPRRPEMSRGLSGVGR